MVEEMVAAINALTREALCEAFKVVFASNAAVTALQNTEALGPLRAVLAPIPTPLAFMSDVGSRVALTKEDRRALDTVSVLLDMLGDGSDLASHRRSGSTVHSPPPASVSLLEMIDDMHRAFSTGMQGVMLLRWWILPGHGALVQSSLKKRVPCCLLPCNMCRWYVGAWCWRAGTHGARDSSRGAVHDRALRFTADSEASTAVC